MSAFRDRKLCQLNWVFTGLALDLQEQRRLLQRLGLGLCWDKVRAMLVLGVGRELRQGWCWGRAGHRAGTEAGLG